MRVGIVKQFKSVSSILWVVKLPVLQPKASLATFDLRGGKLLHQLLNYFRKFGYLSCWIQIH